MSSPTSAVSARYGLALLTCVSFFNYLDRMVIAVLIEPIKQDLDLTDAQMGLVAGFAFALLYALCGLPLARIADRKSRVKLLVICLTAWSAMTALTGLARNFTQLFIVRMAVGVGEAGCVPAAHSIIGDLYSPERRAFAIGVFQAGGLVGMSAGLTLAGMMADHWGWRTSLIVTGLAGLPLAALMAFTFREPARKIAVSATEQAESMITALRGLASKRALSHLVVGISVGAFATYGMAQWLPTFFVRTHGLTLTETGLYGAIAGGGGGVLGTIIGGWALFRLLPRDVRWELWWPFLCYLIAAPLFICIFLSSHIVVAFICQFFATLFAAAGSTVALSAIQSFAEPHRRATAIAVMLLLSSLIGLGFGPVAVGVMSDALNAQTGTDSLRYALMVSTILLFWAALHFLMAAKSARQDRIS